MIAFVPLLQIISMRFSNRLQSYEIFFVYANIFASFSRKGQYYAKYSIFAKSSWQKQDFLVQIIWPVLVGQRESNLSRMERKWTGNGPGMER